MLNDNIFMELAIIISACIVTGIYYIRKFNRDELQQKIQVLKDRIDALEDVERSHRESSIRNHNEIRHLKNKQSCSRVVRHLRRAGM